MRYSESQKKSSNEIVLALLPMVPLFVVSALRVNVGTDYKNYLRIYSTFIQEGIQGRLEPGFYYLCRLIDFCNLPSQMIFVVSSAMMTNTEHDLENKIGMKIEEWKKLCENTLKDKAKAERFREILLKKLSEVL